MTAITIYGAVERQRYATDVAEGLEAKSSTISICVKGEWVNFQRNQFYIFSSSSECASAPCKEFAPPGAMSFL